MPWPEGSLSGRESDVALCVFVRDGVRGATDLRRLFALCVDPEVFVPITVPIQLGRLHLPH